MYLKYDKGLGFMDVSYLKFASVSDLVELVNLAGFSEAEARGVEN